MDVSEGIWASLVLGLFLQLFESLQLFPNEKFKKSKIIVVIKKEKRKTLQTTRLQLALFSILHLALDFPMNSDATEG